MFKVLSPNAVAIFAFLLAIMTAHEAEAYIGPGAGFAFIGSFFMMFMALLAAATVILMWPVRVLIYYLRRKKGYTKADLGRAIVIGLDGLDPELTKKYMDAGRMPNFKKIMDSGSFMPLETTCPSISPVAWSSFATGLTPARHGIFDFLDRDLRSYLPILSSASIGKVEKSIKLAGFIIPLKKPSIKLLRKGVPFWSFLGERGISCSVLRVPITFPPEKYEGRLLSAMCTPDMKGSQGTFSFYTESIIEKKKHEGGQVFDIRLEDCVARTHISGPHNTFLEGSPACEIPLTVNVDKEKKRAAFSVSGNEFVLAQDKYSPWIKLVFPLAPGIKARGICRFLITSFNPFQFYVTPVNIDPESPALPISHPKPYAVYLGKLLGSYATLGLAEDTWALNERVIGDQHFIDQCYLIHAEREAMLMNELEKVRKGLVVCVFDITDRMQHMFWRYLDPAHPALEGKDKTEFAGSVEDLYANMDAMIGRVAEKLGHNDLFMVMSDHGFASFRRGVNLNSWLLENGYLVLKEGALPSADEWFSNVDWKRTKAYAVGLGGICLNVKGREAQGIVPKGKAVDDLKVELREKLKDLVDAEKGVSPIRDVYDLKVLYKGPYLENGPELVIGFNEGYRVSWGCAKGVVDGVVFRDNTKSWSGDHCTDYSVVPGVILSNRKLDVRKANIIDLGPTIIKAFGFEVPTRMEGRPLF